MSIRRRSWPRRFSPLKQISQVPLASVQQALIALFHAWGQPQCIRVDNGLPFGEPGSDVIPVLALWLIGLGVDVLWNRPRQPTDNAKVERMQGVTVRWAEPQQCASLEILQQHLDAAAILQRNHYRVRRLGNRSRLEVYPGLLAGGRPYEEGAFDLERVLRFLAQGQWVRKVNKVGQIDFFNQRWSLGRRYRRQHVCLHLDLEDRCWVVRDEDGREIKRLSASFLSAENIWGLSLSQRTMNKTIRRRR